MLQKLPTLNLRLCSCNDRDKRPRALILALGNPILSDDRVGWEIADRLARRLPNVDILKESAATLDLLPQLAGYERIAVLDAIKLGAPAGTVHRFTLDDFAATIRASSPHDINFVTAFATARTWGFEVPDDILIFAIEAVELTRFGEAFSPELKRKIGAAADEIEDALREWLGRSTRDSSSGAGSSPV